MGSLLNKAEPEQRTVYFHRQNNQQLRSNHVQTTKYTWYSFLPKAILLQFVRPANFVYLISAVLQSIKVISSLNPITAVAPFVFVIGISLIRQGYEDYVRVILFQKRYKKDKEINQRPTMRLINGEFVTIKWMELHAGDIVKVKSNETIPADFVLLYTSQQNSLCYVETANLDGETNLKAKFVFHEQLNIPPAQFESLRGKMVVDRPNSNLHQFNGLITIQGRDEKNIDFQNLLLRETVLKNTEEVMGVVVYAGYDTKIVQNHGHTENKVSHIQRKVNIIQGVLLGILILLSASCTIGFAFYHTRTHNRKDLKHLSPQVNNSDLEIALIYFSSFLLLTFLIPISLNVSIEVIKGFLGIFLEFDNKMVKQSIDKGCSANNVTILQELGQVDYVLTDKTGTLTANQMIFKHLAVSNQCFSSTEMLQKIVQLRSIPDFHNFWIGLLICHDVVYEAQSKKYQGSSPDQVCFISYARTIGYEFEGRTKTKIFLKVQQQKISYDLLQILPFDSRKRMSVIVRNQKSKQIFIYTKGADSCVLAKSIPGSHDKYYQQNITRFAKQGYRTLLFAARKMSDEEYFNLQRQKQQIIRIKTNKSEDATQIEKRQSELIQKFESQLSLIGATAIQDRLQDKVPQTIERLQSAGIVVMMITGDKLETAQNIGYLSNFIKQLSVVYRFYADMPQSQMDTIVSKISAQKQASNISVIVQGSSISKFIHAESANYKKLLQKVSSIIFCRSSPKQKAMIVKHIKQQMKGIVLAIGDGGNDVGMIQVANVGVGILGKQGNSASTASDFSITQFKHLDRLLLHHGRWFYYRLSYFFVFYGWKNLMMTLLLYFYIIDSAFSAASGLSQPFITIYNVVIALVLVVYYSVFQQDVNDDLYPTAYAQLPLFYKDTKKSDLFSYQRYIIWTFFAVIISVFIYLNTRFSIGSTYAIDSHGHIGSFAHHSEVLAISLSIIVIMILISDIKSFTRFLTVVVILIITILGTMAFFLFQSYVTIGTGTNYMIISMSTFRFWLTIFVNVAIVYCGKMIIDSWMMLYNQTSVQRFIRLSHYKNNLVSPSSSSTFHNLKTS